jgi:hypothetical protein
MHAVRSAEDFLGGGDKRKLEKFETSPGASTQAPGGQPLLLWNQVFAFTRDLPDEPAEMLLTFKVRSKGGGTCAAHVHLCRLAGDRWLTGGLAGRVRRFLVAWHLICTGWGVRRRRRRRRGGEDRRGVRITGGHAGGRAATLHVATAA